MCCMWCVCGVYVCAYVNCVCVVCVWCVWLFLGILCVSGVCVHECSACVVRVLWCVCVCVVCVVCGVCVRVCVCLRLCV